MAKHFPESIVDLVLDTRLLDRYPPNFEDMERDEFTIRVDDITLRYRKSLSGWSPHISVSADLIDGDGYASESVRIIDTTLSPEDLSNEKNLIVNFFQKATMARVMYKEHHHGNMIQEVYQGLKKAMN